MFVDSDDEIIASPINELMSKAIGEYDIIIFDRYFNKKNKNIYNTVLTEAQANNLEELLKSFILKSCIGWIHGLLYRKQFLIEKSLYFSTNTIQQEDRDFNFKLFQESPNHDHQLSWWFGLVL